MQNLIQIIYISRSTFESTELVNGIEPNVARILMKSRTNNKERGLVGVLYFGDGCFFQCLEGEEEAVDRLYATLLKDERHKDLELLSRKPIEALSFSDWAMKYVPLESKMMALLKANGHDSFNPYIFNQSMTDSVLQLLHSTTDDTVQKTTETIIQKIDKQQSTQSNGFPLGLLVLLALVPLVAFGLYVILGK